MVSQLYVYAHREPKDPLHNTCIRDEGSEPPLYLELDYTLSYQDILDNRQLRQHYTSYTVIDQL